MDNYIDENCGIVGGDVFDLIGDVDPTDEDGDIGMGDSTGVSTSLDSEIFSGGKKCQESNISDSDNTGDGGKIVGGTIGACGGIVAYKEVMEVLVRCWSVGDMVVRSW
nr:hypothetical protein [Tanacetum cinerariifolium]